MYATSIFEKKMNRTEQGFNSLVNLSYNMNSYRKYYSNLPPSHTIKDCPSYMPSYGHFINGFIAGDGSLYLRTTANFGSMGIQISQHINNKPVMREIADYFYTNININNHSKDAIPITVGGKKIMKRCYFSSFLNLYFTWNQIGTSC